MRDNRMWWFLAAVILFAIISLVVVAVNRKSTTGDTVIGEPQENIGDDRFVLIVPDQKPDAGLIYTNLTNEEPVHIVVRDASGSVVGTTYAEMGRDRIGNIEVVGGTINGQRYGVELYLDGNDDQAFDETDERVMTAEGQPILINVLVDESVIGDLKG